MLMQDLIRKYGWEIMPVLSSIGVQVLSNANVFFVDSGATQKLDAADGEHGNSWNMPFATLDYAVGKCTANNGDIILLAPGHAENLAADSAVNIDIAGITVIGVGTGPDRPTFTCTAIAGDFKLAAAGTKVMNILFLNNVGASTGMIEISGADCVLKNFEIRELTGASYQADVLISVLPAAGRLYLGDFVIKGTATAGANTAIDLAGCHDSLIEDFTIIGNYAAAIIECITIASLRTQVCNATMWTQNAVDLCVKDTIAGSSLICGPNLNLILTDDAANITEAITAAAAYIFPPVYVVNAAGEQAMASNITASTDA